MPRFQAAHVSTPRAGGFRCILRPLIAELKMGAAQRHALRRWSASRTKQVLNRKTLSHLWQSVAKSASLTPSTDKLVLLAAAAHSQKRRLHAAPLLSHEGKSPSRDRMPSIDVSGCMQTGVRSSSLATRLTACSLIRQPELMTLTSAQPGKRQAQQSVRLASDNRRISEPMSCPRHSSLRVSKRLSSNRQTAEVSHRRTGDRSHHKRPQPEDAQHQPMCSYFRNATTGDWTQSPAF
jgi:hypothetical protein